MDMRLFTSGALVGLALTASVAAAEPPNASKHTPRAYLGVAVGPAQNGQQPGVVVHEVTPDSPAALAGLQPGDVIVKVGDRDVREPDDLIAAVSRHKPGEKLAFHVMRGGQPGEHTVTLGERPRTLAGGELMGGFLGVLTRPLIAADNERLGVTADHGAVVMEVLPDSPADRAGLRRGDVITAANGRPIAGPVELRRSIAQIGAGKDITLLVLRGQEKKEIRTRLEESPVEGITTDALGSRPLTSQFLDTEKVNDLQRRVADLERRVRDLEQRRGPEK